MAVLAHRPFVVDDLVEVCAAWLPVDSQPGHQRTGAGAAPHVVTEFGRVGQHGGHQVARCHLHPAHTDRAGGVEAELAQGLEHIDELIAEPVLEGDPADVDPAWHEDDFLVLHVDAAESPDVLGEDEGLHLAEGFGGEPSALTLIDDGRVEALLDRRPDAERGGEGEAVDHKVAAVAYADLVDPGKEMVRCVSGDDITCLLYTSPSPRDRTRSRMPSSA